MARRSLRQSELEEIAQDLFEEREQDDETYFPSSDSEFSEEEIEQQAEEGAIEPLLLVSKRKKLCFPMYL